MWSIFSGPYFNYRRHPPPAGPQCRVAVTARQRCRGGQPWPRRCMCDLVCGGVAPRPAPSRSESPFRVSYPDRNSKSSIRVTILDYISESERSALPLFLSCPPTPGHCPYHRSLVPNGARRHTAASTPDPSDPYRGWGRGCRAAGLNGEGGGWRAVRGGGRGSRGERGGAGAEHRPLALRAGPAAAARPGAATGAQHPSPGRSTPEWHSAGRLHRRT